MQRIFIILSIIIFFSGGYCRPVALAASPATPPQSQLNSCRNCHAQIELDNNHELLCTQCHRGNSTTKDKTKAHAGLLAHPASPQNMQSTCGACHQAQVTSCAKSSHFTLRPVINTTRDYFGIITPLANLTEIPLNKRPSTPDELVNNMLRRQCLRCHVYTAGDNYPYVRRGTGCAACHLQFTNGKLDGHTFIRPGQRQCLSCHYGNHVGNDFAGSYEHDYNWEYRTPYTTREPFVRPYGIELHQLTPDIHFQKGFTCLDCHTGAELSGNQKKISCAACHDPKVIPPALSNIRKQQDRFILTTIGDGKNHFIPRLTHPAHARYPQVACQVCHAQWAFNDSSMYLMLSYSTDAEPWERLTIQSSSQVEAFLDHNLNSDDDERDPTMADTVTGRILPGIWYQGFTQRRWKDIIIRQDRDGRIKVFRPILDLHLSAIDENDNVLFDNITGQGSGLLPYTPHTTGPAGLFYEQRFLHLLDKFTQKKRNK